MSLRALERAGLLLLTVAALVLWLAYPVAPTFDSQWSLVWGRELLDGGLPSFDGYRVPTEHPLWVAASVLLVPLGGDAAPRALTLLVLLSYVAVLAGLYRLGRHAFGVAAGVVAVVLLVSRLDFGFWALSGFVDVPYLALLTWAAALEAERPRRGTAVWLLLGAAGLLRPEAWLFAGAYGLWVVWPRRRETAAWVRAGAWVAAPVALWALTDLVVTGNPAYSFSMSTDHAAELGRSRSLLDLPRSTLSSAEEVLKPPVVLLGLLGFGAALRVRRRVRLRVPLVFLALGLVGFVVVSATGFSVIPRYFATPALPVVLFAALALTGWTRLASGAGRTAWAAVALVAVLAGGAWQVTRFDPAKVVEELRYRERVVAELDAALDTPAARDGRRCGPTSVPNHLLQPYVIWDLHTSPGAVVARTDTSRPSPRSGVALLTLTGRLNAHPAYGPLNPRLRDPVTVLIPPDGFLRAATAPLFATYVGCPS
ncbi:MAG: hypothetical protein M3417_11985 [Actinomycetota bacterium]|nr:hypothetical protein [Actinomycetota bacterium]